MRFRVLGTLAAEFDGKPAALGGPKQRALLALLVAAGGDAVSVDAIVDGVWGEHPPKAVMTSVHTYVSNLRAAAGVEIERVGGAYRLAVEPEEIDWMVFERLLDEGRRTLPTNARKAGQTLRLALSLWRGRPYADLNDAPGLDAEVRRLEELRLAAVEARVDADLASGRHHTVIGELEALTAESPLHEGFRTRHMLALYRDGRQAEALRVYQAARTVLVEEIGVEPSPELQALEERILAHDPSLVAATTTVTQTVTFLFTDIEDSTTLWETRPEDMRAALAHHDEILDKAIDQAGGRIFKHTGDGVLAAFASVRDAANAAVQAQRDMIARDWGAVGQIRLRMGVDVGEAEARGGDFFGPPLNRAARFMAAAHGGQIVLTEPAQEALRHEPGIKLLNLGEHRFKGLGAPHAVYQLIVDGLPESFPPLRTDAPAVDAGRQFGDAVRGYELRERIGAGRFGVVYRAYQPSVGREVAIKVIRPEFANHPEFVRRFEGEARLIAKLEHPHIVSLYDFWRDHEGAYLVMPFLVGRSLAGSPLGVMSLHQVLPMVRQIGSGLAYAHRQGVIHRDVKPANILLDAGGNAYLADFGVAIRAVERASGIQPPSQVYRAPEERAGQALDARTDVYSFGAVVIELLTGRPAGPEALAALGDDVAEVLAAATAEVISHRPSSVEDLVAGLERLAGDETPHAALRPVYIRNPYKGLAAFDTADARDFFGRDREIEELAGLVFENRFVTVVGPSGSGKSSLVRAGLIPALARDAIAGSSAWLAATMVPGAFPFDELAPALAHVATEPMGESATELRADPHGLLRVVKRLTHAVDGALLLVVDQFEELYTLARSADERRAFIGALCAAIDDPRSRLRVVTTVRADFFDRPLADDQLASRVVGAHLAIGVPDAERLVEIIEGPAEAAGVWLEPGLPAQITSDVRDQPGALPLLEFVLSDLVAASPDGRVTFEGYRRRGGVRGAIGRRADQVYADLGSNQPVAEQVFVRLVRVSADTDDVRRRLRRRELEGLGFERSALDTVLDSFGGARLLTFDRDPVTRGPTVEVAHEAILREWPRLRLWVEDRRESLQVHHRLAQAQEAWEDAGRSDDELPGGARLAHFEAWLDDPLVDATADEHEFVTMAIDHRDRLARERARRRRQITSGFGVAALVAVVLAVVAWVQRGETAREASLADARGLILEAEKTMELDPELSMLLGLEAIGQFLAAGEVPASAINVLRGGIAHQRIVARYPGGVFVSVSRDGSKMATAGEGGGVVIWDLLANEVIGDVPSVDGIEPLAAFFSDSSDEVLVELDDGTGQILELRIFDTSAWTWDSSFRFALPDGRVTDRQDLSWYWNADGDFARFSLSRQGDLRVADRAGTELFSAVGLGWTGAPAFSDDGRIAYGAVEGDRHFVIEADATTGTEIQRVPVTEAPGMMAYQPGGPLLALIAQHTAAVIDLDEGEELWFDDSLGRTGWPLWLEGSGDFLTGFEGALHILNGRTGVSRSLVANRGITGAYDVLPGTSRIATAGSDLQTLIVEPDGLGLADVRQFDTPVIPAISSRMSPDGARIFSHNPRHFTTQDSATGDRIIEHETPNPDDYPGAAAAQFAVASRDGSFVAGFDNERYRVWHMSNGRVAYSAPAGAIIRAVSSDGSMVVERHAGESGSRLVSTETGETLHSLEEGPMLFKAFFSLDGSYVITSNNGTESPAYRLWDTTSGERLNEWGDFNGIGGLKVDFTQDGRRLVLGGIDGVVVVFDFDQLSRGIEPEAAVIRRISAHDTLILSVRLSRDDRLLATNAWDEPVKVWDLDTGQPVGEFGAGFGSGSFHPLKDLLYVIENGTISVHSLDLDELIEIAQLRLTRELTEEECQQFLRRACER